MSTNTPRTDSQVDLSDNVMDGIYIVDADFARQLETELFDAQEKYRVDELAWRDRNFKSIERRQQLSAELTTANARIAELEQALTSAIERMQAVTVRELTDMLMDAPNYKSGAEYIRARLIEAAKG